MKLYIVLCSLRYNSILADHYIEKIIPLEDLFVR